MSNEIQLSFEAGHNCYARIRNTTGQVWNTSGTPAFEAWVDGNVGDYDIALVDKDGGDYRGDMPAIPEQNVKVDAFIRAGSVPAVADELIDGAEGFWDGTNLLDGSLSGVVEGSLTFVQTLRLMLAVLTGKASGGGSTAIAFQDLADTKPRVSATVDSSGNRTAVTLDAD